MDVFAAACERKDCPIAEGDLFSLEEFVRNEVPSRRAHNIICSLAAETEPAGGPWYLAIRAASHTFGAIMDIIALNMASFSDHVRTALHFARMFARENDDPAFALSMARMIHSLCDLSRATSENAEKFGFSETAGWDAPVWSKNVARVALARMCSHNTSAQTPSRSSLWWMRIVDIIRLADLRDTGPLETLPNRVSTGVLVPAGEFAVAIRRHELMFRDADAATYNRLCKWSADGMACYIAWRVKTRGLHRWDPISAVMSLTVFALCARRGVVYPGQTHEFTDMLEAGWDSLIEVMQRSELFDPAGDREISEDDFRTCRALSDIMYDIVQSLCLGRRNDTAARVAVSMYRAIGAAPTSVPARIPSMRTAMMRLVLEAGMDAPSREAAAFFTELARETGNEEIVTLADDFCACEFTFRPTICVTSESDAARRNVRVVSDAIKRMQQGPRRPGDDLIIFMGIPILFGGLFSRERGLPECCMGGLARYIMCAATQATAPFWHVALWIAGAASRLPGGGISQAEIASLTEGVTRALRASYRTSLEFDAGVARLACLSGAPGLRDAFVRAIDKIIPRIVAPAAVRMPPSIFYAVFVSCECCFAAGKPDPVIRIRDWARDVKTRPAVLPYADASMAEKIAQCYIDGPERASACERILEAIQENEGDASECATVAAACALCSAVDTLRPFPAQLAANIRTALPMLAATLARQFPRFYMIAERARALETLEGNFRRIDPAVNACLSAAGFQLPVRVPSISTRVVSHASGVPVSTLSDVVRIFMFQHSRRRDPPEAEQRDESPPTKRRHCARK